MAGMFLGGYEVIRRIGSGGMAEVFEARRLGFGGFQQRVALKCIRSELASDERFVQQFINEARLGSQLQHPNIVAVQDFNLVDGVLYMAMEFVDGIDVQSLITHHKSAGTPFPPGLVAHILLQVLAGLAFAHHATDTDGNPLQVIHRDIKPANIMLNRQGLVKIADFGIAKAASNLVQTQTGGLVKGSLAYMAPEQVAGQGVSPQSDLYAVAVVLYEMLTLERLFAGDLITNVIYKITVSDIQAELEALRLTHPPFHPLISRALSIDPADRYPDATSFADELRPYAEEGNAQQRLRTVVEAVLQEKGARKSVFTDSGTWVSSLSGGISSATLPGISTGGTSIGPSSGLQNMGIGGGTGVGIDLSATGAPASSPFPASQQPGVEGRSALNAPLPPLSALARRPAVLATAAAGLLLLGGMGWLLSGPGSTPEPTQVTQGQRNEEQASRTQLEETQHAAIPKHVDPGKLLWVRGSEMVEIARGPFRVGAQDKIQSLETFYIDRYEVTNGQYLEFLEACPPGSACGPSKVPAYLQLATPEDLLTIASIPVSSVSWDEAAAYAKWAGKELPSSMQWEKAARGVDGRQYPWGDGFEARGHAAWLNAPAGSERGRPMGLISESVIASAFMGDMSPYGVYGMAGNVAEWTVDADARLPGQRVVAGGSWSPGGAETARVFARQSMGQGDRTTSIGFRCVMGELAAAKAGSPLVVQRLKQQAKLRMGGEVYQNAMLRKEGEKGFGGLEYELGQAIAKHTAASLEVVEGLYARLPGMLVAGNFDMILGGYVPDRRIQGVTWSVPYLEFGLCLIIRKDSPIRGLADLAGKRVGIFNDAAAERAVRGLVPGVGQLLTFDEGHLESLVQKRLDAVIYDAPYALDEIKEYQKQLRIVAFNLNRSAYHVGVRQGEWSLLALINEAIQQLRTSPAYPEIVARNLGGRIAFGILGLHLGPVARVEAGDTIGSLTTRHLGSRDRMKEVMQLNRDWLKDPNDLQAGMYLKMPGASSPPTR